LKVCGLEGIQLFLDKLVLSYYVNTGDHVIELSGLAKSNDEDCQITEIEIL
jgi:hypothetical protein